MIDYNCLNTIVLNSHFGSSNSNSNFDQNNRTINANIINANNNTTGVPVRFLRVKYNDIILSEDIYQQDKRGMIKYQDSLADSRMRDYLGKIKSTYEEITESSIGFRYLSDKNDVHHINRSEGRKTYYYYMRIVDFEIIEPDGKE
jgi:hypothetical protein